MSGDVDRNFAALKALHGASVLLKEGGQPVVLLPGLSFRGACANVTMDVLLHPSAHSGYVTRLFFQRQIAERGQNWTSHRVIEREWWAPSWNEVQPTLAWPSMLCAHLAAVK